MKIAIDGNLMVGKKTGMGTVVYNVLKYWRRTLNVKVTVYVPDSLDKEYAELLSNNGIEIKQLEKVNYLKWEQIVLPKAIRVDKPDVLWCPYNTAPLSLSCKSIVTINDVIYMHVRLNSASTLYKKLGIIYRKTIVPKAARKADKVITISKYAKNEIISCFPYCRDKTKVIYLGQDVSNECLNATDKEKFFKRFNIRDNYILGFGSIEKRKNSMRLVKAYEALPGSLKNIYQLVLFGFRGYEESEEKKYIEDHQLKNIVLLSYVSDEEKNTLYRNSTCFVFPSLSEGFGLPVLEAFSNDAPVITSNTTSLPEVAGGAAILVNPKKIGEIKNSIEKVLSDSDLRDEMVKKGKEQLPKFDWKVTADNIYNEILSLSTT